jgi:hypothetical protein
MPTPQQTLRQAYDDGYVTLPEKDLRNLRLRGWREVCRREGRPCVSLQLCQAPFWSDVSLYVEGAVISDAADAAVVRLLRGAADTTFTCEKAMFGDFDDPGDPVPPSRYTARVLSTEAVAVAKMLADLAIEHGVGATVIDPCELPPEGGQS